MGYLRRKIDSYLADWQRDKDRKPLIVKGARQIGKTETHQYKIPRLLIFGVVGVVVVC